MADAPVLGAGSSECGFKSHLPHQKMRYIARYNAFFFSNNTLSRFYKKS